MDVLRDDKSLGNEAMLLVLKEGQDVDNRCNREKYAQLDWGLSLAYV